MKPIFALQALLGLVAAVPTASEASHGIEKRQATLTKWCSPTTSLCYNQYTTGGGSAFRIAIADSSTTAGAFDIAIQLVAPTGQGWVGLSWGGGMSQAPLTVAWPNGQDVTLSSRWANAHTMPTMYNDATYTVLADTGVNGTHYTLSVVCKGCSTWTRPTGTRTLSPNGGVRLAWAQNTQAASVAQPANPASNFNYHQYLGYFDASFQDSKVPAAQFSAAVAMTKAGVNSAAATPVPSF
ncbi:hypothetical protein jhhlp_001580 [Lomentospora prolificans]|uniref:DOMON domain-containing protein n=1 Tax=Lomentospora prolificans TaxID=41688 RepID=A0A2N3NIM6_9PEZI|nr:hypothetical protein jhhlp_001580 [Lomentospora prolificans]